VTGVQTCALPISKESCTVSESTEIDFAKAIAQQVGAEKSIGKDNLRRFKAVDTKTSNCVFIRTTLEHPDDLLLSFMSDVATTGITKTRFILKIFPVTGTCRSTEDKIEKLVEDLLAKQFSNQSLGSYAILYKVRCNSLGREHILPLVGRVVQHTCPGSNVDLSNPDVMISIDVLGKFCCVSIMKDFYKFKKYNVQEIGKFIGATSEAILDQKSDQESVVFKVVEVTTVSKSEDSGDVKLDVPKVHPIQPDAEVDSGCIVVESSESSVPGVPSVVTSVDNASRDVVNVGSP